MRSSVLTLDNRDPWYLTLLEAALKRADTVAEAVGVANEALREFPTEKAGRWLIGAPVESLRALLEADRWRGETASW